MANISEQYACVYVRKSYYLLGGRGRKKKSEHVYSLQVYCIGQLLSITG